jgi:hypothetical protein
MTDEPLLRKLEVKRGRSLRLIAAPDDYLARITPLPDGSTLVSGGFADVVQVFVRNKADVEAHVEDALQAAGPSGVLWMTYPKTVSDADSDMSRDEGWDALRNMGWRPVMQISIDAVWSALRFRPEMDVTPRAR